MREIKFLGNTRRGNDNRNYRYSLFFCPCCFAEVEKRTKDGLKASYCSHKCYAKNRERRGPYKESVLISGYVYVQKPEHPNATKKGYVAEHRLVAEDSIGRMIEYHEVVHHINENKTDNRPENLMVMSASDHMRLHKMEAPRDEFGKFAVQV